MLKTEFYRNPRKTDWGAFRNHLIQSRTSYHQQIRTAEELESEVNSLQDRIEAAYNACCPLTKKAISRNVPWWSEELSVLRAEARRLGNKKKTSGNREAHKAALTKYNAEVRRAKKRSMACFCENIETMPEATRLQKALSKDHTNGLGQLKKADGTLTATNKETLEVLMSTHFPDSTESNRDNVSRSTVHSIGRRAIRQSAKLARRLFTKSSINWAISSFEPMKSPGPDGIYPIFLQKAATEIMAELINIFRTSFTIAHVPDCWRKVNVVFIPKVAKSDDTMPKAFRPISLTSTLLKFMKKIMNNHIRTKYLKDFPLHRHQYAYQAGKSTETALHTLVTLIEKSFEFKETALCAFLDIEGAFDNTSFDSIKTALLAREVDNATVSWIHAMLTSRLISATHGDATITITPAKGCPQGGVLSPLLWSLVVDSLLHNLTSHGHEVIGYADDVVLISRGKYDSVLSDRLQSAINHTMQWCGRNGLNINPAKTVILPFTKRRSHNLNAPSLRGEQLNLSKEVKYLGVILDQKLNWTAHLDYAIKKATTAIWACSKLFGKTWGLKPKLALWSYYTIARPRITYASVIWWPKVTELTAQSKLTKVQRLACMSVTSAMKTTPTAALEAMLFMLPLHLHVKKEAELGALRLQRNNMLIAGCSTGHLRIMQEIKLNPLLTTVSDYMLARPTMDIPYELLTLSREVWIHGGPALPNGTVRFYTDGSKMGEHTGSGVYGPGIKVSIPMGVWPTVFQAEVYAICICARICLKRGYRHAKIGIFSDSQAALLALTSTNCESKLVWECIATLRELSQVNKVLLGWVPGHCGIEGNERADCLARQGSSSQFIGPEPFIGTSKGAAKQELNKWANNEFVNHWNTIDGLRQAKYFITPNPTITKKLLGLKRSELRIITGLLTGHCPARYHLNKIGRWPNNLCRFCNHEPESSVHLLCHCGVLMRYRLRFFGSRLTTPYDVWHSHPKKAISFINCVVPDWDISTSSQIQDSSPSQ